MTNPGSLILQYHICNTKDTTGQHFNQPDHHGLEDVEVHIVDFVHAHPLIPQTTKVPRAEEYN